MRGSSPIVVTAALSIAILFVATGVHIGSKLKPAPVAAATLPQKPAKIPSYMPIEDGNQNGTPDWLDELQKSGITLAETATSSIGAGSSTDPLTDVGADIASSLFGGYLSLKQYDQYTPERGEQLGQSVAASIRAPEVFVPHTVHELALRDEASTDDAIAYRSDMREALAPIVNDGDPEFTLFANYIATRDRSWLDKINAVAATYRDAEQNLLNVEVPTDATPEHLRALNAIGAYASTLERLVLFVNDPLATLALIKTYNENERELLLSFDALAKYYVRTIVQ